MEKYGNKFDSGGHKQANASRSIRSLLRHPLFIIASVIAIGLCVHPKLLNIHRFFKSAAEPIPMNFVSNFYLWTRQNSQTPEKLVAGAIDDLENSKFKSHKTYFIIHGFTRNGLDQWIINIKNALLWRENCNVISVDWEAGSVSVGYYVIQERVSLVAEDIVKLLNFLHQHNRISFKDVHLIGHSLGAHIAGFTGKYLGGAIKRITGLDPASLGFNSVGADSRLDRSDAEFVDAIHTQGCYTIMNQWTDCFGTYDNVADADFWPNGGEHQPACDEDGDGPRYVREGSNCDHGMAYVYYAESIKFYTTTTRYLARNCSTYEHFNNGSCACANPPQYMGYNVNPSLSGVFYLNTSKTMPYGILEPYCSPAEYSLFRIIGMTACILLVLLGIFHSTLNLTSICGHGESVRKVKAISSKVNFILPFKGRIDYA